MEDYCYQDNMGIMDEIIQSLMMTRTIEDIEGYEEAIQMTFLKMFPCANEQATIIEKLFHEYAADYTVKEWYESLFKIPIEERLD